MTQPPNEHGDVLRRVLRAEADAVVPSPEGLEIIRARIERRGVRNMFWWRAGAAAASAVLVAGTIVMVVPELRDKVTETLIQPIATSSNVPTDSSTSRPAPTRPTHSDHPPAVVPVTPTTHPPQRSTETAKSTSKPTPTPTPTTCPTDEQQPEPPTPADCPTPTASPTPTPSESLTPVTTCPPEGCPPNDPAASPTQATSPLLDGAPISSTPQVP